ncbi:MAG: HEAT repeat domain-containing protein [Fimbriimonadaceae bacterium]
MKFIGRTISNDKYRTLAKILMSDLEATSIQELSDIVSDESASAEDRRKAAKALGCIGDESSLLVLRPHQDDKQLGITASWARKRIMRRAMQDARRQLRDLGLQLATELSVERHDDLVAILTDTRQSLERRRKACAALGYLEVRSAVSILVDVVQANDAELPWIAANALASIKSRRATRPLMKIVRTAPNERSQQAAIYALWLLGDTRARSVVRWVLSGLATAGSHTRSLALEALGAYGPTKRDLDIIIRQSTNPAPEIRYTAVLILKRFARDERVRGALEARLSDDESWRDKGPISELARDALSVLGGGKRSTGDESVLK